MSEQPRGLDPAQDDSESDSGESVVALVAGREKRATAGNRLSALVNQEQDDELELLFAGEDEEQDESFDENDDGLASDAVGGDDFSSSDSEGPAAPGDDDELAGEKDLQRQDRADRKKRKAQNLSKMPGLSRKKIKHSAVQKSKTTTSQEPVTSSKSKVMQSSRQEHTVSGPARVQDAPMRLSSRKHAVENREIVQQRLIESEKQRVKIMRQIEDAQRRKIEARPKALTQAQRLINAAEIEERNAKSLNRWEEAEKKRAEEQAARLLALQNRQLSGPVVTWWSGLACWQNGKVIRIGSANIPTSDDRHRLDQVSVTQDTNDKEAGFMPSVTSVAAPDDSSIGSSMPFASKIQEPADLDKADATRQDSAPAHDTRSDFSSQMPPELSRKTPQADDSERSGPASSPLITSRNLLALKNIDTKAMELPELRDSILLKKKAPKLAKVPQAHCAITGQHARFRDPSTGLAYSSIRAYQDIKRLAKDHLQWSELLDSYVGYQSMAAHGVPDWFLNPG